MHFWYWENPNMFPLNESLRSGAKHWEYPMVPSIFIEPFQAGHHGSTIEDGYMIVSDLSGQIMQVVPESDLPCPTDTSLEPQI
jgi:hypothetical protein